MRRIVGQTGKIIVATAVEDRRITDRTAIVRAAEQMGIGRHATGVGDVLVSGIVARLVVKGLHIKGEKTRIIVRAGKVGAAAEDDTVVGGGEVGISVVVPCRDRPVQIHLGLPGTDLCPRARSERQEDQGESENPVHRSDISHVITQTLNG